MMSRILTHLFDPKKNNLCKNSSLQSEIRCSFSSTFKTSSFSSNIQNNYYNISCRKYWKNPYSQGIHEPFYPIIGKNPTICNADEAVSIVKSKMRVFVHSAAATPTLLLEALCRHAKAKDLRNIEIIHIHTEGPAPQVSDEYRKHFRDNSFFIAGNVRKAVNAGQADFTPIFLSEIPRLLESPDYTLNVALLQVSPPDKHGYCSLGTSVDCSRSAALAADNIIALVNKHVPRTHGDGHIHVSHFSSMVYHDEPLRQLHAGGGGGGDDKNDPALTKIGQIIAEKLIPDCACLQMGIGGIPDAVLGSLGGHRDIGIHTEMFSDGLLNLINTGVVSNAYKSHHRGKVVTSFCVGTQKLYDFINDNPLVLFCDCSYVNDTHVIRSNNLTHAINSCIEVDITGQVCADSIGTKMYSGIGGQMDFMRGAALSQGGKAIMALSSTTSKGESKIVPVLKPGAGVVTTRAHVQYIVTEYGCAKLYGKPLRERARELINIAHPDHREMLEKSAHERFGKLDLNE